MRARAEVVSPGNVELTLTLTLTVKQWKELAAVLPREWPGWPVASLIRQAIEGTVGHVENATEVTA